MAAHPATISSAERTRTATAGAVPGHIDWRRVASLLHASRALDDIEESRLLPERKVLYQFSARGHDFAQILLGLELTDAHDGVTVYYRSRPLMLALGVSLEDAAAGPLARGGSFSGGRDIGVVFNLPRRSGATVLPACGGVGAQYTPAAGWAQAIRYRHETLGDQSYARSIAVVLGGDASCATNGFWSALNIATTLKLPLLFYIEDNGFGISVSSHLQTPGGNIAANLRSFAGLTILEGDGTDPPAAAELMRRAVARVREERSPLLLRLTLPRLPGHAGQDAQDYESAQVLADARGRDPLTHLHECLVPAVMAEGEWVRLASEARHEVERAIERALARAPPDPQELTRHVFSESSHATHSLQEQGGLAPERHVFAPSSLTAQPEATRINMLTAIRRTLDVELAANPRMVVFGEDVGPKGGVHGATLGLRGNDPVIFFEHRAMLDGAWARRPYPGNEFVVPFGQARLLRAGTELTVVSWGAMVERCELACARSQVDVELLDLRTLSPWDKAAVHASVEKTHRCLIVHEDNLTAGFGAEIAASLVQESFFSLEAPIERLAMPDIPSPHSPVLLDAALPDVGRITQSIQRLASL